jgi:hypothetical protein
MQGKREFNDNMRERFIYNADRAQDQGEYFYNLINNWARQYKDLADPELASSAKDYFGSLDEALDRGKQDVNAIFEAAEQVETDYAAKFADVAFEMSMFADRITALAGVLRNPAPELAANPFAAPDFAERLEQAKIDLLKKEQSLYAQAIAAGSLKMPSLLNKLLWGNQDISLGVRATFMARSDVEDVKWQRSEGGKSMITVAFKDGRDPKILQEGEDFYIRDGQAYFYNKARNILEARGLKLIMRKRKAVAPQ